MTAEDQVRAILTKLSKLPTLYPFDGYGCNAERPYPDFVLVGSPKPYEAPPETPARKLYCAGIGCGVSITFLSAWISLSLYLIDLNPL